MVGVWDGNKLGWIPNDNHASQFHPNIPMIRRCSTILPSVSHLEAQTSPTCLHLHCLTVRGKWGLLGISGKKVTSEIFLIEILVEGEREENLEEILRSLLTTSPENSTEISSDLPRDLPREYIFKDYSEDTLRYERLCSKLFRRPVWNNIHLWSPCFIGAPQKESVPCLNGNCHVLMQLLRYASYPLVWWGMVRHPLHIG